MGGGRGEEATARQQQYIGSEGEVAAGRNGKERGV